MKTAREKRGGYLVIEVLETWLGADKATAFKESVTRSIEGDSLLILLDLSRVNFIDSSGLGALLSIVKRIPKSKKLLICGTTAPVTRMFMLTRLDRIFTMVPSVEDVIAHQLV
jgi:anti-sigma B factor antagonist